MTSIELKHELYAVVRGPGQFLFISLKLERGKRYNSNVHADQKLDKVDPFTLIRIRLKNRNDDLIEQKTFNLLTRFLGW